MLLDVYDKVCLEHCYFLVKEIEEKSIIEKIIKPDYKILDLGSNIGYYALIFKIKFVKQYNFS